MEQKRYEINVREEAELIAATIVKGYEFMTGRQKTRAENKLIPLAKMMLDRQANYFSMGYGEGVKHGDYTLSTKLMFNRGLLPLE